MKERLNQAIRERLSNDRNQDGVTLIELLAVIIILAVIAAIAVPVVLGSISKSKDNVTQQNMSVIVEALNRYATNNGGKYPTSNSLTDATTVLGPPLTNDSDKTGETYLKSIPNDGWGQHFKYQSTNGTSFLLESSNSSWWMNSTMASPSNTGTPSE